jgi:hypothetical protein
MHVWNDYSTCSLLKSLISHARKQWRIANSIIVGANIYIFVFCLINLFWNQLFLRAANTNTWILPPTPNYRVCHATARKALAQKVSKACTTNSCNYTTFRLYIVWRQVIVYLHACIITCIQRLPACMHCPRLGQFVNLWRHAWIS